MLVSNPNNISLEEAEQRIRACLIDGEYFYPERAGIPMFRFHRYCENEVWYEMESLELVEGRKCKECIDAFILRLGNNDNGL
ncbi:MAG: hypothetical protein ACERKD_22880 [Prolixibacteraceae bacterium]